MTVLGLSLLSGGCTTAHYGIVAVPCEVDADHDLVCEANDCDDNDASIRPTATETPGDGIDSNCDGEDDPVDDTGANAP